LSALELVGPLVCLAAAPEICRHRAVCVWVDNSGSVTIWEKGYSLNCQLSNALVKAAATVAAALGCRFFVKKIARCSNTRAVLADLLSKGRAREFRETARAGGLEFPAAPLQIPVEILQWVQDPTGDDQLGTRLLRRLGLDGRGPVASTA